MSTPAAAGGLFERPHQRPFPGTFERQSFRLVVGAAD